MTPYLRRLPQAALHLMAFTWSAAVILTLATWILVPLPLWLLLLAYLLPALGRSRSAALGTAAAVLVAAGPVLLVPLADLFFAVVLLLAQSARALTLSRHPSVHVLRAEQRRGLALILLVVLMRAIVGRPDVWPIALLAALYLAGTLVGLPLAHSREAGDAGTAGPGLRLAALLGSVTAAIAAVIGLVHLAATHHVFDFLVTFLAWLFRPIAYAIGYLVQSLLGLLPRHLPQHLRPQHEKSRPRGFPIKMHGYSHAFIVHLEVALVVLFVLFVALIAYLLYRRQQMREFAQASDPNAPAPGDGLGPERVGKQRRPRDYGEGPRRLVRRTVGLHLRRVGLPPGTTARSYAQSHGWEDGMLATYEHARYGFVEPLPESRARAFVSAFVRRFGRRPPRRRGPGG